MEQIELYYKKLEIIACHINKHIDETESIEDKTLLNTKIEKNKDNIKTFLAKTLPYQDNFRKQSTKVFSSDYYIYPGLKRIWEHLDDESKATFWKLLFEMFIISNQIFPIVKQTTYTYISIYLLLEEIKTDIPLPKISPLVIISVLAKEATNHINRDFEEGKISKVMIEMLIEELKCEDVTTLTDAQKIKEQFQVLFEKEDVQKIVKVLKHYFTEYVIDRVGNDFKNVFESKTFKNFTNQYSKEKLISMLQKQEFSFVNIRQMIYDSGVIDLLGEDFEFPTCFAEFVIMVKKYTGQEIEETDIKGLFEKNLSQLSEMPVFKKFIKNSGFNHILNPILEMFKKTDHQAEKLKRKEKRQKKKLKKMKKDNDN